jgi:heterodisulfide reductase subunit B
MFQEQRAAQMGKKIYLPIFYFTELIGLACGSPETTTWLSRHLVDPVPLLQDKGLWS